MIIDITIHYRAKPERRSAIKRRFAESVQLDLREVAAEDAPLAVEWEHGKTRWFNGGHYRLDGLIFNEGMSPDGKAHELIRYIVGEAARDHTPIRSYIDSSSCSDDRKYSPTRYPDVTDSAERQEAIARVQAFVSNTILVGGGLWSRCAEPRLVYHPPSKLIHSHVLIDTNHYSTSTDGCGNHVRRPSLFVAANSASLDDMDSIMEIAGAFAVPPTVPDFTLHLPDSISTPDPDEMLLAVAEGMLEERGKMPSFAVKPAEAALGNLTAYVSGGGRDGDELAAMLLSVSSQLEDCDRAALLRRSVRRWEDRSIGSDLSPHFSGRKQ